MSKIQPKKSAARHSFMRMATLAKEVELFPLLIAVAELVAKLLHFIL